MNINKHNYEAFFLDYHEGNLSPEEVAELLLFVEQHPELKEEFESFENIALEVSDEKFLNKFSLKHNSNVSDDLLIASVEGLLTKEESILLKQQLVVDRDLQKSLSIYQKTIVSPDLSVVYENKEELKRSKRRVVPFYYYVAAAAAILLLFGLFTVFKTNNVEQPELAKKEVQSPKSKVQNSSATAPVEKENSVNLSEVRSSSVKNVQNSKFKIQNSVHDSNVKPENNLANNEPSFAKASEDKPENKNIVPENPVANNQKPESNEAIANNMPPSNNNQQPTINNEAIAKVDLKDQNDHYMTLAEAATTRIKEKALSKEMVAAEKQSGKFKKVSGWDVLAVIAKGASKLTGKKVEVKPTYNDEGDVTAYAFNAGKIGFSKGK